MKVVIVYALALVALANGQANIAEPKVCEPGSTMTLDCNSCSCRTDGAGWACTRKACIDPNIAEPAHTIQRLGRETKPDDKSLEDVESSHSLRICEPGSTKMEDCNSCICITGGSGWACTRKMCEPNIAVIHPDSSTTQPEPAHAYQRFGRETKPDDKSLEDVERSHSLRICEPGSTKMEDCNSCSCTLDGSGWACTLMGCHTHFFPIIPDITQPESASSLSQRLKREPGKKVCKLGAIESLDCNSCFCVSHGDGGSAWACTLKGCL